MKILLYILSIKLFILLFIYYLLFCEHKEIKIDSQGFTDSEMFLFKTFVIDHAVTGM